MKPMSPLSITSPANHGIFQSDTSQRLITMPPKNDMPLLLIHIHLPKAIKIRSSFRRMVTVLCVSMHPHRHLPHRFAQHDTFFYSHTYTIPVCISHLHSDRDTFPLPRHHNLLRTGNVHICLKNIPLPHSLRICYHMLQIRTSPQGRSSQND